jgi:metal-dependent HD superfamily phosphatase/phosphodiesterase
VKRIFSQDDATGITKYWHVTGNGEYVVETQQNVSAIVEANKRQYNDTPNKHGDLNKVATIPLSVYYELKRKGIADDPKALKKWINDRDNRVFRTRAGTL